MKCVICKAYVDEEITKRLLRIAEETARSGVQVDIREFQAAPA